MHRHTVNTQCSQRQTVELVNMLAGFPHTLAPSTDGRTTGTLRQCGEKWWQMEERLPNSIMKVWKWTNTLIIPKRIIIIYCQIKAERIFVLTTFSNSKVALLLLESVYRNCLDRPEGKKEVTGESALKTGERKYKEQQDTTTWIHRKSMCWGEYAIKWYIILLWCNRMIKTTLQAYGEISECAAASGLLRGLNHNFPVLVHCHHCLNVV